MARLLSVNVGLPRDIQWKGLTVHTGIWKNPVRGRCRAGRLNLDGDGQGDSQYDYFAVLVLKDVFFAGRHVSGSRGLLPDC
jgi:hypothetical protein